MKKLLLDIRTAIADFGAENIDASHFFHLYRKVYTKSDIAVQIEVGPWHANPVRCIEVELLITQTPEGPQFDEAAAREWLESLKLNLPPDEDDEALHRAADKARELGETGGAVIHVSGDLNKEDLDALKEAVVNAGPAFTNAKHVDEIVTAGRTAMQVTGAHAADAHLAAIGASLEPRTGTYKRTEEEKKAYIALNAEADKVREIINGVKRGKYIRHRRVSALEIAGYNISWGTIIKNFGKSGTVKAQDGKILAQLEANVNYTDCYVFEITKQS